MFCYDTSSNMIKGDMGGFDPLKCNATKCYAEHYQNSLTLAFFIQEGSVAEKKQAQIELEMCERKMKYWKRQPHFSPELSAANVEKLNKRWQDKRLNR